MDKKYKLLTEFTRQELTPNYKLCINVKTGIFYRCNEHAIHQFNEAVCTSIHEWDSTRSTK